MFGLRPYSLTAVERRSNGDFALVIRGQRVGGRWQRVIRIPQKRVFGYRPRTPDVQERGVRARRKANARKFAMWALDQISWDCPLVKRALWERDLTAVDELRSAILLLAPRQDGDDLAVCPGGREHDWRYLGIGSFTEDGDWLRVGQCRRCRVGYLAAV